MRQISFIFLLLPLLLKAQSDSIKILPVFSIIDSLKNPLKNSFSVEFKQKDMIPKLNQNLSEMLQNQSGVAIKSYGPGQLATPTFRGGDANQTIVLWNGAKLNSPSLGSIDFSLIPTDLFQDISLISSSSSNLFGVGGIGGGVLLNSYPKTDDFECKLGLGVASFGQNQFQFKLNLPIKNLLEGKFALLFQTNETNAENNFSFLDIYNEPYSLQIQTHSRFKMRSSQIGLIYKFKKIDFTLINWSNYANRQIPQPINLHESKSQFQQDTNLRSQFIVNYNPSQYQSFRWMIFSDFSVNRYQDTIAEIDNPNRYNNFQSQLDWAIQFNKARGLSAMNQLNTNYTQAKSDNFNGQNEQLGFGTLHQLKLKSSKARYDIAAGMRTLIQDSLFKVLPFIHLSVRSKKLLIPEFYVNYSKSARFPALNELYWNPGGNILLRPEEALNAELGAKTRSWKKISFETSFYYSIAENRIRWIPNGSLFSPMNVAESKTFGSDSKLTWYILDQNKVRIKLSWLQSFVQSTGKINQQTNWKSLSYIPNIKSAMSLKADFKEFSGFVNYSFVSKRFITNDESAYMPQYHLLNFGSIYSKHGVTLMVNIDNVLNTHYQVIAWRPMAGRTFNFSMTFSL